MVKYNIEIIMDMHSLVNTFDIQANILPLVILNVKETIIYKNMFHPFLFLY